MRKVYNSPDFLKARMKEYRAWAAMKRRCDNPISKDYIRYGARGIKVCDRWLDSFENFFEDMGFAPSISHSLDRVKNDLGYDKDNCKWATKKDQQNNMRTNDMISFRWEIKTLTQWANQFGLRPAVLRARIHKLKWDVLRSLTTPLDTRYSHNVKSKSISA